MSEIGLVALIANKRSHYDAEYDGEVPFTTAQAETFFVAIETLLAQQAEKDKRIADADAALFEPIQSDASLNLQGALEDLRQFDPQDGGVIARTLDRVIDQLELARAALKGSSNQSSTNEGKDER